MDEMVYRQTLLTMDSRHCPFEITVLTQCAGCSKAEKHNIAEREIVSCNQSEALEHCVTLREALRHNFTFALGKLHITGPLPHAQEMRIQCGGLKGLQVSLDGSHQVRDVSELVSLALHKFGEFANFPYVQIVHSANEYHRTR